MVNTAGAVVSGTVLLVILIRGLVMGGNVRGGITLSGVKANSPAEDDVAGAVAIAANVRPRVAEVTRTGFTGIAAGTCSFCDRSAAPVRFGVIEAPLTDAFLVQRRTSNVLRDLK